MRKVICATRGRGENWKQTLEIGTDEYSHTITSVQKDNYVMEIPDEKKAICEVKIMSIGRGEYKGMISSIYPTISTSSWEANNLLVEYYDDVCLKAGKYGRVIEKKPSTIDRELNLWDI